MRVVFITQINRPSALLWNSRMVEIWNIRLKKDKSSKDKDRTTESMKNTFGKWHIRYFAG